MEKQKKKHFGKDVIACNVCGQEFIFVINPNSNKYVPVDIATYTGQSVYDGSVHSSHNRTCAAKVAKKEAAVASAFSAQELIVIEPFDREFIVTATGDKKTFHFDWKEVFRLDAKGEFYVGPIKEGIITKVERKRLVDDNGNLLEHPAKFFTINRKAGANANTEG